MSAKEVEDKINVSAFLALPAPRRSRALSNDGRSGRCGGGGGGSDRQQQARTKWMEN